MNSTKNLLTTTTAVAAALLLCGSNAVAQPFGPDPTYAIGVNFVNTNLSGIGGAGIDDRPNSLLPSEQAGVYPQSNWNNAGSWGGGNFTVTNSAGSPVALTLNWDSAANDPSGSVALNTPDGKLMDGFIYTWGPGAGQPMGNSIYGAHTQNKPLVYINGLQSWYGGVSGAEGYGVVLYTRGFPWWATGEGWVQSVSGDPLASTMVAGADLTPHKSVVNTDSFTGTYVPAVASPTYGGNYMFFSGLTNDAILIRFQTPVNYGAGLNGFQLVPVFPAPATAAPPTFSPGDTVYAGETATLTEVASGCPFHPELWYQWQSDYGAGTPLTFSDITDATNTTVSLTPSNNVAPYTVNFRVIVTNVHGASTSSVVTLNVNPAVPPYITQDTTPGAGNAVSAAYAYVGGSITFNAAFGGPTPITYNWQSNLVNIANATNTSLTLNNLQLSSAGSYGLAAANQFGSTTNTATTLDVLPAPSAPTSATAYPYAIYTNGPVAYWRLNETLDNINYTVQAYDHSGNNNNGTYGTGGSDNQASVVSPTYPGFEVDNVSAYFIDNTSNSFVTVPALNLNTNTVTITAWINPGVGQGSDTGLFVWASGANKAGLRFGSATSGGMAELGYLWNTSSGGSGLFPPLGSWSFVVLTVTPTNRTIYLYYIDSGAGTTNLLKSVQTAAHAPASFSGGTTWIGSDTEPSRNFYGNMDEVAVFNKALSEDQVQDLFLKAIGATAVAPVFTQQPTNAIGPIFGNQEIQMSAVAGGAPAPAYQWESSAPGAGIFTALVNGNGVAGANTATLSLSANAMTASRDYRVVASNAGGSIASDVCAVTLTPVPTNGLWTARYQVTNSSGYLGWVDGYGSGSYTGLGVLGSGTFWNAIPGTGQWGWGPTFTSASDFRDDGATHSGITCQLTGAGLSLAAASAPYAATDRRGLFSQFIRYTPGAGVSVTNAIVLSGVPNGTYNLAFHAQDAPWVDRGATFTVHGANGDQTVGASNTLQFTYFASEDTSVVVTNVVVSGGVLNVDVMPTLVVRASANNGEFMLNGVEIQLVSYAPPTAGFNATATNVFVSQPVTFVNAASPVTNLLWNFGDGNTLSTTTNGNVSHAYANPGTYTVSQTVTGPGGTASETKTAYIVVSPKPTIGSVSMSSGNLVLSGANGIEGASYRILSSTNVTVPLVNWTPVETNVFGPGGSYSYTNSSPTNPASFFILVTP